MFPCKAMSCLFCFQEDLQSENESLSVSNIETKRESKNEEDFGKSSVTDLLLSILSSSTTPSKCKASTQSTEMLLLQKHSTYDVSADASVPVSWGCQNGSLKPHDQQCVECLQGSGENFICDGLEAAAQDQCQERHSSATVFLRLPPMSEKSLLLSETFRACIYSVLPNIVKGRHWIMLYRYFVHTCQTIPCM